MTMQAPGWRWKLFRSVILSADILSLQAGLVLAAAARYEGSVDRMDKSGLVIGMALLALTYPLVSAALRLHQGRYAVGSADECKALCVAVSAGALAVLAADVCSGPVRLMPL